LHAAGIRLATATLIASLFWSLVAGAGEPGGAMPEELLTPEELALRELQMRGNAPPVLVVEPRSVRVTLTRGQNAISRLTIRNGGGSTLAWSVLSAPGWVRLDRLSGEIGHRGKQPAVVVIDAGSLRPGTETGRLVIAAPDAEGSPATVEVTAVVLPGGPGGPARPDEPVGSAPPASTLSPQPSPAGPGHVRRMPRFHVTGRADWAFEGDGGPGESVWGAPGRVAVEFTSASGRWGVRQERGFGVRWFNEPGGTGAEVEFKQDITSLRLYAPSHGRRGERTSCLVFSLGPAGVRHRVHLAGVDEFYRADYFALGAGYRYVAASGFTMEASVIAGPYLDGDDIVPTYLDFFGARQELDVDRPAYMLMVGYTY
jgi:hypothetical protein